MRTDISLKIGTTSGALLSIAPNIYSEDILKTVILAVVGTTVSFSASLFLKWFTKPKK